MTLSVILVTYNSAPLLQGMLASLHRASRQIDLHCIVIDNASRDGSVQALQRGGLQHVLIRNATNVGFGRASNQAIPHLRGRYVLLLNPDVLLSAGDLAQAIAFMEAHPRCGVLGVKLLGPDGALQPCCRYFPTPVKLFARACGLAALFPRLLEEDAGWQHGAARKCDWVPGCFYLLRREVLQDVGLFDPRFFLYYEEVDHCRAAKRAGWDVMCFPGVSVTHIGGESARTEGEVTETGRQILPLHLESELLYFRKNHGALGVWSHALLMTIAAMLACCKRVIRRRRGADIRRKWREAALLWSTFRRTAWGTRPTR